MLEKLSSRSSVEVIVCNWAVHCKNSARYVRRSDIRKILNTGLFVFNLRVGYTHLPYKQEVLGFTWSFFRPKGKQDVHGLPAVEIYGILGEKT